MKKLFLSAMLGLSLISCTALQNQKTMTTDWKHNTNIYEVNVRQFSKEGTFKAVEKELPRLKRMGVETLWFMPITPIAQKNKKGTLGSQYAAQDYTSINPEFGTLEDFKSVINEAHKLGFKVIIDWVANHTGWDHVWTKTHPDFYLMDPKTNDFQIASGMDDIIELNYQNPKMREAMIEAMKYWVRETNIDGFRCDLASWVEVDFWQQAKPEVETIKPLFWLGEYDELDNPDYATVFDASYSWKWMHLTKEFYQKKLPLTDLTNLLSQYSTIGNKSMRAWFTTNHDENTWNGTEYEKYGEMAKTLAVFSATWNGVPLMYNGQELPLLNKRLEFFEKDPIPWNGENKLENFYKKLFELKSKNPALRGGDDQATTQILQTSAPDQVLAYIRKNGNDEVLVILNLSDSQHLKVQILDETVKGKFKSIFSGLTTDFDTKPTIEMYKWEHIVFEK
ncbi:alpha-amylase family glycosyl hydrolase [Cloacibacterium sp. TD35]|uniref:alpha-amylase family glycosyl hydrolase n=1 Tax=Cloacibacterium sp. TD35 TaxID=2976818 RepID=UPI00237E09D4|nr:alpha-amylase family glycosyl hydrolase [Cloacibacterium sp. TD35]WDT68048.1 alpha-amylase family glycosyl hydrolase [Cloacibacterium sp. TD35]